MKNHKPNGISKVNMTNSIKKGSGMATPARVFSNYARDFSPKLTPTTILSPAKVLGFK